MNLTVISSGITNHTPIVYQPNRMPKASYSVDLLNTLLKGNNVKQSITGYGLDREQPISRNRAKELAGPFALPRLGHELQIAARKDQWGFWCDIWLQNVGGRYVLASTCYTKDKWPEMFGIVA